MGLEEIIIILWLKNHTTEEKLELVRRMMPDILESMNREELMTLASQIVPEMMKRCWDCMSKDDLIENSHTVIDQMLEHSFSPLSVENQKDILGFLRNRLSQMEQKYVLQSASQD